MPLFVALCLLSRLAYAFNDVLVGRLARRYTQLEVAALRGLALGLTMAPLLLWVDAPAWTALGRRWPLLLLLVAVTAVSNLLQNQAARLLPFGLRSAVIISVVAVASVAFGAAFFAERLSLVQSALCLLLVASAAGGALGTHAAHEIRPDIPRGCALALGGGLGLALAAALTKRLAVESDPLLVAWAWEFGAGVVLVPALAWQWRSRLPVDWGPRFVRTAAASAPTVVGSAASLVALDLGALGLWGALAGTQVLFTALLGVRWHGEAMGVRRWFCFATGAAAVAGLSLSLSGR